MKSIVHIDDSTSAQGPVSPLKRKHDGNGGINVQIRLRQIKKIESESLVTARGGFLFSSSDILLLQSSGLLLLRNIIDHSNPTDVTPISEHHHDIEVSDGMCALSHLEGNWRELVGASREGTVFSVVIDDDGHITTVLHENVIRAEKCTGEIVTAIYHAGKLIIYYIYAVVIPCFNFSY